MDYRIPQIKSNYGVITKPAKGMPPVSYRNTKSLAYDNMAPIKIDAAYREFKSPNTLRELNTK